MYELLIMCCIAEIRWSIIDNYSEQLVPIYLTMITTAMIMTMVIKPNYNLMRLSRVWKNINIIRIICKYNTEHPLFYIWGTLIRMK